MVLKKKKKKLKLTVVQVTHMWDVANGLPTRVRARILARVL